ncbi:MAG TPA: S-methyl-5'-thioinosine phosphorylase [Candidatus Acidoferrum sp.]|nr:S-methyl-5'-thioinosine phosphorylase [Candidatus Acidoferrum sp.]
MPTSSRPDAGKLAVIGGSGLYQLGVGELTTTHQVTTPFASEPVEVEQEQLAGGAVLFMPRHGKQHRIAPHRINYRANLWALQQLGVDRIIAVNAVGGISPGLIAGRIVIPDQLIDYTWGREHTFFDTVQGLDSHVDFTTPYDSELSQLLARCCKRADVEYRAGGAYGCTQGPRLETAAEIERMARDGCDIVGMTAMPEAALARELGLRYASLALVVNRAAGRGDGSITQAAINAVLQQGIQTLRQVLALACAG